MKKNRSIFTFLFVVFLSYFFYSCDEIESDDYLVPAGNNEWLGRRVLLEDFTGMLCVNCPAAADIAHNLQSVYPEKVIVIANHVNRTNSPALGSRDSMTSRIGDEYYSRFATTNMNLPMGMVNRINSGANRVLDRGVWAETVVGQLAMMPDFSLELSTGYLPESRSLTVTATARPTKNLDGKYLLSVLILQDEIISSQRTPASTVNDYQHQHVLRDVLTTSTGMVLSNGLLNKDQILENQINYTIPEQWERGGTPIVENCKIVAFISNASNEEVLQACEAKVLK